MTLKIQSFTIKSNGEAVQAGFPSPAVNKSKTILILLHI